MLRLPLLLALPLMTMAQPSPEPPNVLPEVMGDRPTTRPPDGRAPEAATRADAPLEAGRTSFTEAQARSRIEQAGYSAVADLRLDENGIWRGTAQRDGRARRVGLDYRGTVRAE